LEKAEERRSPLMMSFARFGFGELDRLEGDLGSARHHYLAALEGLEKSPHGPRHMDAVVHAGMAHLDVADSDLDSAQTHLETALGLAVSVHVPVPVSMVTSKPVVRFGATEQIVSSRNWMIWPTS